MQFLNYLHIERLSKPETDGILNGHVLVQAKLDGTNSSIWATKDGVLHYGSRKRELSLDNDNANFMHYMSTSDDGTPSYLREFCLDNPDVIVYGEFLAGVDGAKMAGSLRKYLEGGFYAFDLREFDEDNINDEYVQKHLGYLSPDDSRYQELSRALGNHFIQPLAWFDNPTEDDILKLVEENHYNLPEDVLGEGVVIKNYDFRSKWGNYEVAKIVRAEFKENKGRKKVVVSAGEVEQSIVDNYVTNADCEKCKQKVMVALDMDEWDNKSGKAIGYFLNMLMTDLVVEEFAEILKKYKKPTIDFAKLDGLIKIKGREFLGL